MFDSILKTQYNYNTLAFPFVYHMSIELGILQIVITLTVLIFSAILHEIAHGYVAERFGDPTARLMGRLTLDPRPHIDPLMSIALPLILLLTGSPIIFGGAKPVPVDEINLRDGKKDMAIVALAGPLTNILIAIAAALLFHGLALLLSRSGGIWVLFLFTFLQIVIQINVLLAVFNLLPIPPLDGSKIFALILPEGISQAYLSIGTFGSIVVLFFIMTPMFQTLLTAINTLALSLLGF
jgi:Zn-dependent protease